MPANETMIPCAHCHELVEATAPYCPKCLQPRITRSLLAARARPAWQLVGWYTLATAVAVVFLVTASVAFLRESKAIRIARQDLSQPDATARTNARSILTTFLERYPEHEEALFLATLANARLETMDDAASLRERLREQEPDRLPELDSEIAESVHASFLARECNAPEVVAFYDVARALGDDYQVTLDDEVRDAIVRCMSAESPEEVAGGAQVLEEMLSREEHAKRLLAAYAERTFLEPVRVALEGGRFEVAQRLAETAAALPPQAAIDALFAGTRKRCELSIERIEAACTSVRAARTGQCFPESAPSEVRSAIDGWGRPLLYRPIHEDDRDGCPGAFELVSFGADGLPSDEARGTPDSDLVCGGNGWSVTRQYPSAFWRPGDD